MKGLIQADKDSSIRNQVCGGESGGHHWGRSHNSGEALCNIHHVLLASQGPSVSHLTHSSPCLGTSIVLIVHVSNLQQREVTELSFHR